MPVRSATADFAAFPAVTVNDPAGAPGTATVIFLTAVETVPPAGAFVSVSV